MEFAEEMQYFAKKIEALQNKGITEEATKMSLIVPFFKTLGYDVFNPLEFSPEYTADVGVKKGEKVDYAIMDGDNPVILIECKPLDDGLDKYTSQLYRYFSVTPAKFGILTNGAIYRFYSDLEDDNKMDMIPFLEVDMRCLNDGQISELKKFCKDTFDSSKILNVATDLKYTSLIKSLLAEEMTNTSEDFVKYILSQIYTGVKTQKVIDKFNGIVKKAFNMYINDTVNQRIASALNDGDASMALHNDYTEETLSDAEPEEKVVTTEEEMEVLYIVKSILGSICHISDIVYRDTESYFNILYTDNIRRPICRFYSNNAKKRIVFPESDGKYVSGFTCMNTVELDNIEQIYQLKNRLIDAVSLWLPDKQNTSIKPFVPNDVIVFE